MCYDIGFKMIFTNMLTCDAYTVFIYHRIVQAFHSLQQTSIFAMYNFLGKTL